MILAPLILDNMVLPAATKNRYPHHQVERKINMEQSKNISDEFICKEVQLRSYVLDDLFQRAYPNQGMYIYHPMYVVLKRCDGHSGCCNSSASRCAPVTIVYDDVEVKIGSFINDLKISGWIRVEQHRECSCKPTSRREKFEREPEVFLL